MRKIEGTAKTVRQLLSAAKYSIDYYQRDYRWGEKQVHELLDDLADQFLEDYSEEHERREVQNYGHYFLGSIIISDKDSKKFIVDGQQRLTTLTLLLIYLHNLQRERKEVSAVAEMIFSEQFGEKSFNIQVDERIPCMEALFENQSYDAEGKPESVQNIVARYDDITNLFPDELSERVLPFFVDWLKENVHLVEITAHSDEDAYTIFETMNDRGLSLSPVDMLKGYLLAGITESTKRTEAHEMWKQRIAALADIGKDVDADFFKAWLRSQYAKNIRAREKGAKPEDFDRIGTEFHRWVRENSHREDLNLTTSGGYCRFIDRDFNFYSRHYLQLVQASSALMPRLEHVYYNAKHGFTLQYPVLLAPLTPEDSEEVALRKLRVVAMYLDILLIRRIWNWHSNDFSTMQYAAFLTMRDIRRLPMDELASVLYQRLKTDRESFTSNDRFFMHQQNRNPVRLILARMTDYIEQQSGQPSHFAEYVTAMGNQRYEVEHIWANHYERHTDEFAHQRDFAEYRNRIGDLLLLPKSFNASYGDLPYDEKVQHYYGQNLLAQSLNEQTYRHNPGFERFVHQSGLRFQPYERFNKEQLDARQALYIELAEHVWNPEQLLREVGR